MSVPFVLIQASGDVVTEELPDGRMSLPRKKIEATVCCVDHVDFFGDERAVFVEAGDGAGEGEG